MRKVLGTLALSLLLLSCQNKNKQEYSPTLKETQSEESYQQPDTAVTEEVKELQEEVKVQSTPTSFSSSRSHESSSYVNMRGQYYQLYQQSRTVLTLSVFYATHHVGGG